jgi:hypothetical protein
MEQDAAIQYCFFSYIFNDGASNETTERWWDGDEVNYAYMKSVYMPLSIENTFQSVVT